MAEADKRVASLEAETTAQRVQRDMDSEAFVAEAVAQAVAQVQDLEAELLKKNNQVRVLFLKGC